MKWRACSRSSNGTGRMRSIGDCRIRNENCEVGVESKNGQKKSKDVSGQTITAPRVPAGTGASGGSVQSRTRCRSDAGPGRHGGERVYERTFDVDVYERSPTVRVH